VGAAPASNGAVNLAELLGEEYSKDPAFKPFKEVGDLAKAYRETKSMVGKPRFDVPAEDADPAVVADFYKKLGVPDAVDGYAFEIPKEYPEHMGEYMKETLDAFAKTAHELKLTPKQAAGLQQWFDKTAIELGGDAFAGRQAEAAAADKALDEYYTQAFGEKKGVISAEVQTILPQAIQDKELFGKISAGLSNEALLAVGAVVQHMKTKYGMADQNIGSDGNNSGMSGDDLRKQAQQLMSSDAYRNPMSKDHAEAKKQVAELYQRFSSLTAQGKSR
jgi:hypothetical protein